MKSKLTVPVKPRKPLNRYITDGVLTTDGKFTLMDILHECAEMQAVCDYDDETSEDIENRCELVWWAFDLIKKNIEAKND